MNTRRYPQQDGIRRLPQPYGPNDMGRVALLLCSAHAATPFYPAIQGIFLRLGVEVDAVKPHSGLSSLGERATVETGVIAVGRRARTTRLAETDAGRRTGVPDAGPLPSESVAGYGPEAP
jgi:hypothetical protein